MTEKQYSITEVANMLELPQHVLRMWESQFSIIKPVRGRNGRRAYTIETIDSIRTVQNLLHGEGLTMTEAKQRLENIPETETSSVSDMATLRDVLAALETASAALSRR